MQLQLPLLPVILLAILRLAQGFALPSPNDAIPQSVENGVLPHTVLDYLKEQGKANPVRTVELGDGVQESLFDFSEEDWNAAVQHLTQSGNTIPLGKSSNNLQKREDETLIYCHRSGSWAHDFTIAAVLQAACGTFAYGAGEFGRTQILERTGLLNEAGDKMKLVFEATINGFKFASTVACQGALQHIIQDACQVCSTSLMRHSIRGWHPKRTHLCSRAKTKTLVEAKL